MIRADLLWDQPISGWAIRKVNDWPIRELVDWISLRCRAVIG